MRRLVSGRSVDLLAEDVRVPNVSRRLLDHVYIDPTQGDLAEVWVWDNVIQLVLRRYPPGLRALLFIL
jgi:hypothetical protein